MNLPPRSPALQELADLSGYTIQIILRLPFDDVSGTGFMSWLPTFCTSYLIAQHDADDDVASTHCHLAVYEPGNKETLRKALIRYGLGGAKSNTLTVTQKGKVPYNFWKLMVYCIKGDSTTFRKTSIAVDGLVGRLQSEWVDYDQMVCQLTEITDLSGNVIDKKFIKRPKEKVHDENSKYSIVQEVVAAIGERAIEDHQLLIIAVRNAIIKRHMVLGMYKVMDICDSVLMYSKAHCIKWTTALAAQLQKRYSY